MSAQPDWQDHQHHDQLLRQEVLVKQLAEAHLLVDACSDHTWLTESDIINIACECGVLKEYEQAIQPKAEGGKDGS